MLQNSDIQHWIAGNKDLLTKTQEDKLMQRLFPQFDNSNKYGYIGESLFEEYLKSQNIKYEKQYKYKQYIFDFKTEDTIYEIKTRRYNMTGTAGEKITNTPHKYRNIPTELKCKFKIILIAYQEIDNQGVFDTDEQNLDYINLWKKHGFEYIRFSQLLNLKQKLIIQPLLKWVGSKSYPYQFFKEQLQTNLKDKQYYIEPFVGSGFVTLQLMQYCYYNDIKIKFILNDINENVINLLKFIKNEDLSKLHTFTNDKDTYVQIRDKFNKKDQPLEEQLSMFLYLNHTSYRGLWRENKSGEFNVPYGNYKTSYIIPNFNDIKFLLNQFDIQFSSKTYTELQIEDNSLVYLDPPYKDTFQNYSKVQFKQDEFEQYCKDINKPNRTIFISNTCDYKLEGYKKTLEYNISNKINVQGGYRTEVLLKNEL